MSEKNEGRDLFWTAAAIALLMVLFCGDPDLADGLRIWVLGKAGVSP